ncbi:MAG: ribonuclease R [Halanaerobiales bacterium]
MSARQKVLSYLKNNVEKPMTAQELYERFEIANDQEKYFSEILEDLVNEGLLVKNSSGQYGIPEKFNLIAGRIDRSPKGFAFLIPDEPGREDIFISSENLNSAMHNDKVFLRLLPDSRGEKDEGEVVKVIERANETIVGNMDKSKHFGFVVPDNKRIFSDVFIPKEKLKGARQGQKVVAKIEQWPEKKRNPEGKIIEILGDKDEAGVDIEAIIRQLQLPQGFSKDVLEEIANIPSEVENTDLSDRKDLRDLDMVTIDGADAKDLDDAVSIEKLDENKLRLGVHIADVTHYVKEGTALDNEARERGTSIYLVDRVIPMLPQKLSNGICSLNPQVDRLAMTVFMDYQLEPFELKNYEITKSIIKTNYRLTYDEVREMLLKNNKEVQEKYSDFFSKLKLMQKLMNKLRTKRFKEGSIDFDFEEVKVILNDQGKPIELKKRKHEVPEKIIEEFMISANKIVAEDMYWRDIPFIYRIHDEPDTDRMQEFNEFIHNFGYHLKGVKNGIHPRALQELLEKVEGKAEQNIIETVLLRSMKKAVYSNLNIGHFGLGLEYYSHFTSPIRRYPDLMIHRIIKEVLDKGYLNNGRKEDLKKQVKNVADHSSLQERRAMEAERDSVDLKKIEFMEDKIAEVYDGIISGVSAFGFFVRLDNTVEGLVHVEDLKDDYYIFEREQHALIGERTKKRFRIGDEVEVKVTGVNLDQRQLDFVLNE